MRKQDYKVDTFVIKLTTMYKGEEESNTFRPCEKHALQMNHIVDRTVLLSPPAGVPVPADSGYVSRDDASTANTAAPDVFDLACALEAVAVAEDLGERQGKLLAYDNRKYYFSKSQRKGGFWKGAQPEFEKTLCRSNRAHFK